MEKETRIFRCVDHGIFDAVGYENPVFYADWVANCPECSQKSWELAKPDQPTEPSLQLLVIDLGDSCVVRAEKGETALQIGKGVWRVDAAEQGYRTQVLYRTFADVRKAIDGERPVPRIEPPSNGNYTLYVGNVVKPYTFDLAAEVVRAVQTLTGKPLPIWTGGTWTQLPSIVENRDDWMRAEWTQNVLPVKIWRYTKH